MSESDLLTQANADANLTENDSDLESDVEIRTPSTNSSKNGETSLDKRLINLSQANSVNQYDSEIFEDTDEEDITSPNKDLDLQAMFGAQKLETKFNHDINTAEGKYSIHTKHLFSSTFSIVP